MSSRPDSAGTQIFGAIWDARPGDRRALERVLATWDAIFPAPPLAAIRRATAPAAASAQLASPVAGARWVPHRQAFLGGRACALWRARGWLRRGTKLDHRQRQVERRVEALLLATAALPLRGWG